MVVKKEGIDTRTLQVLILQGPNLNLLGERERSIYGTMTLEILHLRLEEEADRLGITVKFFQSNHEGELIDRIHEARMDGTDGVIINAGGLTHTSVALRDALVGVDLPYIEVHISNVYAREEFRHVSYLSAKAAGVIAGLGADGYSMALQYLSRFLSGNDQAGRN